MPTDTPMPGRTQRVASLLPSATEMVAAVGALDRLVGRSHECDFPPSVVGATVLTKPRLKLEGPSGDIDRRVREVLERAMTVYEVEVDALRAARPDVIVTQDLCDVCAVSTDDVRRALASLGGAGLAPTLVTLHPKRLADVFDDLVRVGVALGLEPEARLARRDLEERVATIAERAAPLPRPKVLTLEWIDPPMVAGTWMPELITLAGGEVLVTKPGDHAPTLKPSELAALDPKPDVVLVKPCGFDLERSHLELDALRDLLAPMPWPAVRSGRVFLSDGNAFFNRPGPRLVESLEILAACLHPDEFADFAELHAADFHIVSLDS